MKKLSIAFLAACSLLFALPAVKAQDQEVPKEEPKSEARAQLEELVTQVQEKLREGKKTEEELKEDLKQFDELLKKHAENKTDDVAQILFMKAMLYVQVFENNEKGIELVKQLQSEFPETTQGKKAVDLIAALEQAEEAKRVQKSLVEGAAFPDFDEKDLNGDPLSVAKFKGKVVLVDFWATWCGPCIAELPNVLETYEKYHGKGFEIIGISLDREEEKLKSFIEARDMPWPQFFDGKGWQNKLAARYGVQAIPATYLLDGDGKIVAKNLRGPALAAEVGKILDNK